MEEFDFEAYKKMVKTHQDKDDPTGWFESIYKNAKGNHANVFWADLEPSPYLIQWLEENPISENKKAIVIGCGVGDDCEALSQFGYKVIGFDISPSAIQLCQDRYPNSEVNYVVANLFNTPENWIEAFDIVYECNTIQVLPGKYCIQARKNISSLLSKGGHLLVSCRSRDKGKQLDDIPLPLDKNEMDAFINQDNLQECSFLAYNDTQEPPIAHYFGIYKKV